MPYYRIIIWTTRRKLPYSGIRLISNPNINIIYKSMHYKARDLYRGDLIEMEVQMLSKFCRAVSEFERTAPDTEKF